MSRDTNEPGSCLLLVGMMGVGKSSVGRRLAERLGWAFIDSDQQIEARAGQSIAKLFELHGEAHFRGLELEVLRDLPEHGAVIALGGGAVASSASRELLGKKGTLVWLDASIETLLERTGRTGERPLLAGLAATERASRLATLQAERRSAYARARWRLETDGLTPEQVAERILSWHAEESAR